MPTKETVWGNCCGTPRLCRMYAEKTSQKAEDVEGLVVFEAVNKGDIQAVECLDIYTKEIAVQIFNLGVLPVKRTIKNNKFL